MMARDPKIHDRVGVTRRWISVVCLGAAGIGLLWLMWLSGGDFWPSQRPFMPVTLLCASGMIVAAMLAAALPRGSLRQLFTIAAALGVLATFLGEGLAERGRFDQRRVALEQEVQTLTQGGDCITPCRIESLSPLRVAFLMSGQDEHWSGACYDTTDIIYGVEFGGRVRPPDAHEAPILSEASRMFGGQVRHAPAWGQHWYGCTTRP